ncbi:hypothetical protein Salat_0244700 [Sesamum alatum]|uniref:DUF4283 domain-containing protein n=1 Tax=Sesamum alatum TaxID=300844 RepID=A0AAE2CYW0_9LAMI|nr:hypothetical protein Salat_0244700 [Sesamum alatum]
MDQDLHRLGRALNLAEEEENGVVVPLGIWHGEAESHGYFLVGRVLSSKPLHADSLRSVLLSAFNSVWGMDFKAIEDNRFLLRFNHILDKKRVMERCPWAFDKCLLVLAEVDDTQSLGEIELNQCEFHVQVQGLPIGKMTREMALFVGNKIGRFVDLDTSDVGGLWGAFLRIRVVLDICQPLRRLLKIRTVIGDEHIFREGFADPGNDTSFGPWLRAPPTGPEATSELFSISGGETPDCVSPSCSASLEGASSCSSGKEGLLYLQF